MDGREELMHFATSREYSKQHHSLGALKQRKYLLQSLPTIFPILKAGVILHPSSNLRIIIVKTNVSQIEKLREIG